MTEDLMWLAIAILCVWSAVLVWASWQIRRVFGFLAEERRELRHELRRWKRLIELSKRQNQKWQ